jgi:hypothetical protein
MVNQVSKSWMFWLLVLFVAVGLVAAGRLSAQLVHAAPLAAGVTWTCAPDLVVSANVRVVAKCASPYVIGGANPANIYWFAYPTSDSGNASRMLSVFETAKATGSTVTFYFDTTDTSGTAYGCLAGDCRAIWAATTP